MIKNVVNAKMSLKIIIILFLSLKFGLICGNEDSAEGRYIDLLPDKEKKEFLEKIARRILEEVQSRTSDTKSGEVPESKLNQHQEYVANILREEKELYEKSHNVTTVLNKPMLRAIEEKDDQTLDQKKTGSNDGNKTEKLDGVDKTIIEGDKEKKKIQKNKLEKVGETAIKTLKTPEIQLHSHEVKIVSTEKDEVKNNNYTIEITIEDSKHSNEIDKGISKSKQVERQIPVMIEYASDNPERSELHSQEHNSVEKVKYFEKSSHDDLDNTRRLTNVSTTEPPVSITQKIGINDIPSIGTTEKPVRRRKFKVLRQTNRKSYKNNNSSDSNSHKKNELDDVGPSTLKLYTLNEKKVKRSYTTEELTTPMMKINDGTVSALSSTTNKKEELNSTQIGKPNDITNTYNSYNATSKVVSHTTKNFNNNSVMDSNQGAEVDKAVTKATKLNGVNGTHVDEVTTDLIKDTHKVLLPEISSTIKIISENDKETPLNKIENVETVSTKKYLTISTTEHGKDKTSKEAKTTSQPKGVIEISTNAFEISSTAKTVSSTDTTVSSTMETDITTFTETPVKANYVTQVTVDVVTNAYKNPTRTPEIVLTTPRTRTIIAEITDTEKIETGKITYTDLPPDLILRNSVKDLLNMQDLEEVSLLNKQYNLDENSRINNQDDGLNKNNPIVENITDSKLFHDLKKQYNDKNNIKEYIVYEVLNEEDAMKKITGKLVTDVNKPNITDEIVNIVKLPKNTENGLDDVKLLRMNEEDKALRSLNEGLQEQQPYYIPIYNYAPENAYFSAYNKFGPNSEDTRKRFHLNIDLDTKGVYQKSNAYTKAQEPTNTYYNDMPGLGKIIARPNHYGLYSPKPIRTIDYDNSFFDAGGFDRDLKPIFRTQHYKKKNRRKKKKNHSFFPNSNEADHPINWLKSGPFKSQVSAARQLMFKNGHYGTLSQFLPTTTTTTSAPVIIDNKKKKAKKNIRTNVDFSLDNLIAKLSHDTEDIKPKPTKRPIKMKEASFDYLWEREPAPNFPDNNFLQTADNIMEYRASLDSLEEMVNDFLREKRHKNKDDQQKKVDAKDLQMIADMTDAKDLVPTIISLQTLMRSSSSKIEPYINVLKDQIKTENEGLEKFNWLSTTVDIQAALRKLQNITHNILDANEEVPSEDLELYYYLVYLYNDAKLSLEEDIKRHRAKKKIKNAKKYIGNYYSKYKNRPPIFLLDGFKPMDGLKDDTRSIKADEIINLQDFRRSSNDVLKPLVDFAIDNDANEFLKRDAFENKIVDFANFLDEIENTFYDLHNAIKHVALISKNNTNLFKNLKELYLTDVKNKEAIELLLHLELVKILEMVEESAKKGLNDNYLDYMEFNEKHVKNTLEELIIMLRLLNEHGYAKR